MKNKVVILAVLGMVIASNVAIGAKKTKDSVPINIEIKGLRMGMPESEAKSIIDKNGGITIAEVYADYYNLAYHEGKLDKFSFLFKSSEFDSVLGAVKEKYPSLKCSDSTVSNAMGASFDQTECNLISSEAAMVLIRRADVKTSALIISSKRLLDEMAKSNEKSKKDI
jgi:hypothetical protein